MSETGIRWCSVGDDAASMESRLRERFPKAMMVHDPDGLSEHLQWLASLWTDAPSEKAVPLDPVGTPFQKAVWDELRRIPRGRTITYGELARRLGNPKSVRAAAQACGANPILMLVPCHRVIGADGSLTGFAAGLERKRELLRREGVTVAG